MKILCVSQNGELLGLAKRVNDEGHNVTLATDNNIGNGIVKTIPYNSYKKKHDVDVVFIDNPYLGTYADQLRNDGYKVPFCNAWSKALAINTQYNLSVVRTLGFTPYDGTQPGYPLTLEGWFNGNKFVCSYMYKNYTKLMNSDKGPHIPCSGIVLNGRFFNTNLYEQTLSTIEVPLRRTGYSGPVTLDIIINKEGFYVKSIKAWLTSQTLSLLNEIRNREVTEMLLSIYNGSSSTFKVPDCIVSLPLTVPPYPNKATNTVYDVPALDNNKIKHFYLVEMKYTQTYQTGLNTGMVGYATAIGNSTSDDPLREARRRVIRTLNNIGISDGQYRTDIGKHIPAMFSDLTQWKWLQKKEVNYETVSKR